MKYTLVNLTEAPKKICPLCGNPMTGYHYWYKGGWRCKKSSTVAAAQSSGVDQTPTPSTQTSAPTATVAPAPMRTPVAQATKPGDIKLKITAWLNRFNVKTFEIAEDNSVTVKGDVELEDMHWKKIPVKFEKVDGDFVCYGNSLESVENLPEEVTGALILSHNNITTAEGGPKVVGDDVDYSFNPLTSINGLPSQIGGSLSCEGCDGIKSLSGIHKVVKSVKGEVSFYDCPIESHVLGLLRIKGVTRITLANSAVADILNKHLEDRDVAMCQDELIDAGFASFAKL